MDGVTYRIVLPSRPLPRHTQVIGPGPDLYVLWGNDWCPPGPEDIPHKTP
ncbi:hypothetical protein WDA79_01175 [Streptomyces sp. A475]